MATQTMTKPTQTIAAEGEASSAQRGRGPPGDAPDPHWFGGTGHPFNMPGGGGGGGSGGGGGGNPDDQNHGPKLSGKEPVIFDGDQSKAEVFILEWIICLMLNEETEVMSQVFSRTMLFLTFIKGPNIQEWVGLQVGGLGRCLHAGAGKNEEYLYNTVMDSFNTAFTDTMSMQKAKAEFQYIKMEGGDLDTYIAKFERLTRLASYNLQHQIVLDRFGIGLSTGLYIAIVNSAEEPRNWTNWVHTAQKYQQKYLVIHSSLNMRSPKDLKSHKKPQTADQWKMAWKSQRTGTPMPWTQRLVIIEPGKSMQMRGQSL